MSQTGPGLDASFKAGSNLNTSTTDWQPARINSSGSVDIANTTTNRFIGIFQNRPKTGTGASCRIRSTGYSKLTMNDTCASGDLIYLGSGGARKFTGLTITADTQVIGRTTEPSAITGTVVNILLNPYVVHVATGFTTTAVNAGGVNVVGD